MGAVLDLVRVLFEPTAVFERVRERPRFLAPFVALAIVVVLVGVVQLPYIKAAMSAQFSQMPNMPPEAAQRALSFASIGVVFGPIAYAMPHRAIARSRSSSRARSKQRIASSWLNA